MGRRLMQGGSRLVDPRWQILLMADRSWRIAGGRPVVAVVSKTRLDGEKNAILRPARSRASGAGDDIMGSALLGAGSGQDGPSAMTAHRRIDDAPLSPSLAVRRLRGTALRCGSRRGGRLSQLFRPLYVRPRWAGVVPHGRMRGGAVRARILWRRSCLRQCKLRLYRMRGSPIGLWAPRL